MSETFLPTLEKAFRCHIYGGKPRRNVYLLRTSRGHWVVKAYEEEAQARWVTQLGRSLHEQGFHHTVLYLTSIDGCMVIPHDGRYYTVMKAIDGSEAQYASRSDVKKTAETLARFHLVARGTPVKAGVSGVKSPLIEKWEDRLAHFERIVDKIARRGAQSRFEQLVLGMASEAKQDGRRALEAAWHLPLSAEMERAYRLGTLAHRDVASHNFLITERGSCYLIDLDTVAVDMQLADLVQFASRMLLLQGYSLEVFCEAMEAYGKILPLSDGQIQTIHHLLRYPDNVLREVTGVYAKRPGYRVRGVMQLLQLERKYRQERRVFFQAGEWLFGAGWRAG